MYDWSPWESCIYTYTYMYMYKHINIKDNEKQYIDL